MIDFVLSVVAAVAERLALLPERIATIPIIIGDNPFHFVALGVLMVVFALLPGRDPRQGC